MTKTRDTLRELLRARLGGTAAEWFARSCVEIAGGVSHDRFCGLISQASRHARGPLEPTEDEIARAGELLPGWNPERWTLLETLRVALVLAREDLGEAAGAAALEEAFRYADVGELCALYRSLAHLPGAERFTWRAAEGCRTNMRAVFEADACDTPYPVTYFDDVAWNQLAVKCIFIGAPLWRVWGLDRRLSPELARMALDLADERRSAGRPVQHELWLCLGEHAGERGIAALRRELAGSNTLGRRAAALGLARAGRADLLRSALESEQEPSVAETMRVALDGATDQSAFRALDSTSTTKAER